MVPIQSILPIQAASCWTAVSEKQEAVPPLQDASAHPQRTPGHIVAAEQGLALQAVVKL